MDLRLQPLEPTNWNRAEGEELDEQEEDQRIDELKQPTFKVLFIFYCTISCILALV